MTADPSTLVSIPIERTMVGGKWMYSRSPLPTDGSRRSARVSMIHIDGRSLSRDVTFSQIADVGERSPSDQDEVGTFAYFDRPESWSNFIARAERLLLTGIASERRHAGLHIKARVRGEAVATRPVVRAGTMGNSCFVERPDISSERTRVSGTARGSAHAAEFGVEHGWGFQDPGSNVATSSSLAWLAISPQLMVGSMTVLCSLKNWTACRVKSRHHVGDR